MPVVIEETSEIPEAHFDAVNEILAGKPGPIGAYALGLLTTIGKRSGHWPPRAVLDRAAVCQTLEEAFAVARTVLLYAEPTPNQRQ